MSDIIGVSSERLNRANQAAREFIDTVALHLKYVDINVKDWKFTVGASQGSTNVDVAIKLELKPKNPAAQDIIEPEPATPP